MNEMMKELECFFSSLFYNCCEEIARNLWFENIKRDCPYRVPEECKVDKNFWKDYFLPTWNFVQMNLRCRKLILAFDDFSKRELNVDGKSEEYFNLKNLTMNFLHELYSNNSIEKTLKLMEDQNQVDDNLNKKLYLHQLASELCDVFVGPLFYKYDPDFCIDYFYKYLQSKYTFIPEIKGGRTIKKSSIVVHGVSDIANYHFTVLETGERFRSPEQNPRKAFLMHRKLRGPYSCAQEFRLLTHVL